MSLATTKLSSAADVVSSEVQSLIVEMRKALGTMKTLAVDYEKDGKSDKARDRSALTLQDPQSRLASKPLTPERQEVFQVQNLEEAALELIASYQECTSFAEAVQAVPRAYQPSDQMTDFKRLIEAEVNKVKGASPASGQNHPLRRQFREAVWVNRCPVTNKRTLL